MAASPRRFFGALGALTLAILAGCATAPRREAVPNDLQTRAHVIGFPVGIRYFPRDAGHVEEFDAIRSASIALFRSMPAEGWSRGGTASTYHFTVRALAFITAGHVEHHVRIVRERYLRP